MGDRSNAYVTNRDDAGHITDLLDIYWHHAGPENENHVREGLKAAKPRWDDPSYGNAMFIEALPDWPSGMGVGIFDDNSYPVYEVCWSLQKVFLWPERLHADREALNDLSQATSSWTFDQFISI